jgi:bacillopeptidase F
VAGPSSDTLTVHTTAPDPQPTVNLSGTGAFVSAHKATLSWTKSSSEVIGYNVYRSTTPGTGYQLLAFVTSTTFVDSIITSGQTYYWVVTAVAANGAESAYSSQVSAIIPP